MARALAASALKLGVVAFVLSGCRSQPARIPLDPVPMHHAIRIVNDNTGLITGTVRASGSVDGRFSTPDGRSHSYHLDGVLFYLAPIYVRFDLKSFGDRQLLFGSNADNFWYYNKREEAYHCGHHGTAEDLPPEIPIQPDQTVDALGLTPIPTGTTDRVQHVQRVVDDCQQILFLVYDAEDHLLLEKEYWLDRYWPRLVRRVVFRDASGVVEMESMLDDYRPLTPGGPMLPRLMTANWPQSKSQMRFRVRRWKLVEEVGPDSIQFATPHECTEP